MPLTLFKCVRVPAAIAVAALVVTTAVASAQSGPFSKLAGSWSGGGRISFSDGRAERLRCRAYYAVGGGGTVLQLNLRCASDSYNFQLQSHVVSSGGSVSGNWSETTRNVGGSVFGSASGSRIQVRGSSPTFSVGLAMTTSGNRQSVMIRPEGQGDITGASISLSRSG